MSYELVGRPDRFSPAFNPIYFYADSSNKFNEGFKYVVDLYSATTVTNRLARYKIFPAPAADDFVGVIDINQILSSQVSFFRDQDENIIADSIPSYFNYDVYFGEEYVNYWNFFDNFDGQSQTGHPGTGFRSISQPHTFQEGDQIFINQDPGYEQEAYNGVHTVTFVNDQYSFVIDVPFTSTTQNPGTAVYADRRKTLFIGAQELLYNAALADDLIAGDIGWTSYGPDGCAVHLWIPTGGTMQFVIPDAGCSSTLQTSYNTGTTLEPGVTYNFSVTVSNVNNPSSEIQYIRANVGGNFGAAHAGTGTFTDTIVCGTGTTFGLEWFMDADTAGFGSHSMAITAVSLTNEVVQTGYTVFNGAVSHQDLMTYTSSTFTISTGNSINERFLTNAPDGYRVRTDNKMWLDLHATDRNAFYAATLNTRYGEYVLLNLVTGYTPSVYVLPVGPANISAIEGTTGATGFFNWSNDIGTYPIFKDTCWDFFSASGVTTGSTTTLTGTEQSPWYNNFNDEQVEFYIGNTLYNAFIGDTPATNVVELNFPFSSFTISTGTLFQYTDYYTINTINVTGGTSSETLRFNIHEPINRYNNIEIYFIDRLGSLIPKNFELQNAKSIKVNRNEYQTLLGRLSGGKWSFDSMDRGRHVLNTTVIKSVDLTADFITEEESNYLQELISSPEVYIKEFGKLWPVIITENNYAILTKLNKKNIPFKMSIEYANNDRIQNF